MIDFSSLTYPEQIQGDDEQDTAMLHQMHAYAAAWLARFKWCKGVRQSFFGCGIGGICAVFLFEIVPASDDVDRWLWVVVGDIPPAYLVTDAARTAAAALIEYLSQMQGWVSAVEARKPVDELIPVNLSPTLENASSLRRRLESLAKLDISHFRAKGPAYTEPRP